MGATVLHCFIFFLLCLYPCSGSSVAGIPPAEAIKQINQENRILFSFSDFTSQLDSIPIINPSTPTTTTPIVNPYTTPPAPVYTDPNTTPTTPTTTPTMPTTTPTATPTTPTMPTTTPTTPTTTTPAASTGSWCIASPAASETALQVAIDYACGYGGADCSAIQSSGSCYNPNTLRDHASYAFNDYYQKNPAPTSCVFGGTAQLSYTDPSSANCRYAATSTSASVTPVTPATPATPMTPTGSTPTDIPSGSTVYGSEPTATPTLSLAVSMSSSSLLLFTATCFLVSLLTANYV
ncbi:hypothetical protein VitviT2T_015346 [Vitis vinifera]|uniref:X8 domain-containing protein n=3 Tax=Vitis vinifera TaxID=29760 RepID=A0ABY9CQA9_VITVI|nr:PLASMODESMATA CALLOSE-BINDING PROTEIN 2 [Vitis vinifera]WJZ96686.1 hypothetical protein VitviT2T_015346 [Vitis vinifera]|eukprot:XP_010655628.1 PREDICTED: PLASMODESMATA CALLOSE-BINDING PROTEIN 2 isoform X2 [Vitis vinifera]